MFNVTMEPMDGVESSVSVMQVAGLINIMVRSDEGTVAAVEVTPREARIVAKVMQLLAAQVERQEGE